MEIEPSQIPEHVRLISADLRNAGFRSWIVGGCVRDTLRGRSDRISDWDLATDAKPEDVIRIFPKVIPTGMQHGTVTVMMEGFGYEVTTLRGEGAYSDGRRPDEVFFVKSIEEDLARRDFTVNAIAADPITCEITDPWGGMTDLKAGILKAVGDPMARFQEDGLRVLRAARFCSVLQFSLDTGTEAAIRPNLETFAKVAKERVLAELVKAVEKSAMPSLAFGVMRYSGILDTVIEPLAKMDHDHFWHTMDRLDKAPRIFPHAMAAMLLETSESDASVDRLLRSLKMSNADRELVLSIVRGLRGAPSFQEMLSWSPAEMRRWAARMGHSILKDALTVYFLNPGDLGPVGALISRVAEVLHPTAVLDLKGLAVSGDDLQTQLGIAPSRKMGQMLSGLLEYVLEEPARNERNVLLTYARTLL